MKSKYDLFGGLAILGVWGLIIVLVATDLGAPVLTATLYVLLVVLVAMQHLILQSVLGSVPIDDPLAWGLMLVALSILVVIVAPVVGALKVIQAMRGNS